MTVSKNCSPSLKHSMPRKDTTRTPNSQIKSALRQLWLRSRERATVLKGNQYTCQCCGVKQSTAKGREVKVNVHHRSLISWLEIITYIRTNLLEPEQTTLCKACHKKEHEG